MGVSVLYSQFFFVFFLVILSHHLYFVHVIVCVSVRYIEKPYTKSLPTPHPKSNANNFQFKPSYSLHIE